jgi:hypothetical protein
VSEAPTLLIKAGGALLMVGGLLSVLSGGQLLLILYLYGFQKVVPPAMILLGGGVVVAGGGSMRARRVPAIVGLSLGIVLALLNVIWAIYSAANGFFSMWVLFSTSASLLGAVLAGIALPEALKVDAARTALLMD